MKGDVLNLSDRVFYFIHTVKNLGVGGECFISWKINCMPSWLYALLNISLHIPIAQSVIYLSSWVVLIISHQRGSVYAYKKLLLSWNLQRGNAVNRNPGCSVASPDGERRDFFRVLEEYQHTESFVPDEVIFPNINSQLS